MKGSLSDTIAALATPQGPGLRALLRMSGPRSREIAEILGNCALPEREAVAVTIEDAGAQIPAAFVLFVSPRSYTREDLVEIAIPSSPPLIASLLHRLLELGARPAEPGEFTRRAFLNGRIDLSRAEGVLELVRSRNDREAQAGLLLLEGGLSRRVADLRARLESALALLEASLDFEESDTGHVDRAELGAALCLAASDLQEAEQWESRRMAPRGELQMFLWGEPNAGKSSLLNRLDGQARAIVSPIAGTTRDCLRGSLRDGETQIALLDAAGVEEGSDSLSSKTQEIARRFRDAADRVVGVADASKPLPSFLLQGRVDLLVVNKTDLPRVCDLGPWKGRSPVVETSALRGNGIEVLRKALFLLARGVGQAEGESFQMAARHREAFARAAREVVGAQKILSGVGALDAAAAHLREALAALGEIDGQTTPEDILDRIFSQFCIGK